MSRGLTLVGDLPPPWGGIAVHVRSLLELAKRRGVNARVLDVGQGRREREGTGEVLPVTGPADLLQKLSARRKDLVHLHTSGNNEKSWLLALACAGAAPGGLVTVHSGLSPGFLRGSRLARNAAKLVGRRAAKVICASTPIAEAVADAGVPDPVVVPAFTPGEIRPGRPPETALRARGGPLLIAAALAPGPQYGEDVLLRAAARIPEATLVVFGPGTDDPALLARAQAVGAKVVGLGPLEPDAAWGTMALADVFVRPTRADGDSISVREARAMGLRTVASDVGHRPPGVTLFPAGDDRALATAVRAALSRPPAPPLHDDATPRLLALWAEQGVLSPGVN